MTTTTLYKLTDARGQTWAATRWGENVTHIVPMKRRSTELCTDGMIHAHRDADLALLLNPIHGKFFAPRLWEARGTVQASDWGKVGTHRLRTVRELPLPEWYTDPAQHSRVRVSFAVLCAESVLDVFEKRHPRDKRPRQAIEAARAYLAGKPAAHARHSAAEAAYAASASAAYAASAASAAYAAVYAASAASSAYDAAASAASSAVLGADFAALARQAVIMAATEVAPTV